MCSPWDLVLEENGGEQAICPPLANVEKMAGCRAVMTTRTYKIEEGMDGKELASQDAEANWPLPRLVLPP